MIYDQLRVDLRLDPDPAGGVEDTQALPRVPDPLDLTGHDHLAVSTVKVYPADDELPQPPQDPRWVPASAVDEHGLPA